MQIRAIQKNDIDSLLLLLDKAGRESSFASLGHSLDKAKESIGRLVSVGQFVCVAVEDSSVIGIFMGVVQPQWFTDSKIASDILLYVEPESRGTSAGYRLVSAFLAWAIEQGAKQIRVGTSFTQEASTTADRLYEKFGFQPVGKTFLLDIK